MKVTFLNARDFEKMVKENNSRSLYFHAGFGVGRNVEYITQIDGRIYAKLSPIANQIYANTSKEIKGNAANQLERIAYNLRG